MQVNEFSYGGIESSRFFITCDTETHSILPEQRQFITEIPGLDGFYDANIRSYGARILTKPIYFEGDYAFLRKHREQIMAWLSNDGRYKKLIFGDEPDRYYLAKVVAAVEFANTNNRNIGTIQFVCNPPWQYSADGLALTPEYHALVNAAVDNSQFVMEISKVPAVMKIYNVGRPIKPIIKLIGRDPNKVSFTINGQTVSFSGDEDIYEGIVIDCESETVTRMSNGENLYSIMSGGFVILPSGYSEITFNEAGAGEFPESLTAIVEFTPEFGGV